MDIKQALLSLDPENEDLWTADGSPKTGAVSDILGQQVARKDIVAAAPDFNRSHALSLREQEKAGDPTPTEQPPAAQPPQEPEEGTGEGPVRKELPWCPDELLAELEAARAAEGEAAEAVNAAKLAHAEATAAMIKVEEEVEKHRPRHSNQEEIMKFIASQKKAREEAAKKVIQKPVPTSPLDGSLGGRPRQNPNAPTK